VCIKFRSKDYYAKLISHASASKLIAKLHYSQGTSNTSSFAFGLFSVKDNNLVGACLWMCAPCGVAKKFSNTFINDRPLMNTVLTLSRFVLCDNLPKNAASFFLSKCIKHIKKTGKYDCLVTYADQRVGHIGTIYKASNWVYDGETVAYSGWIDENGILRSRLCKGGKTVAEMDKRYTRTTKNKKYRFIYKLKRRKKQISLFHSFY
jgi:hypothetical protein